MTERKSHQTRIALAAVAGLAIAFAAAGCGSSGQRVKSVPVDPANERKVSIPLDMDRSGNVIGVHKPVTDDIQSNNEYAAVSRSKRHGLRWKVDPPNADVVLTVDIKKDFANPFDGPITCLDNQCVSGPTLQFAPVGKFYEYWLNIHDNKSRKDFRIDPIIRVDP
jgi:hypothetical protein